MNSPQNLAPSAWIARFAPLIPTSGPVLDLACGQGRHARFLAGLGLAVEAVDRDEAALAALASMPGIGTRCADLEVGPWPYAPRRFAGIVVTHYLHRPRLPLLLDALAEGGVLLYETFMVGQERFGRPSNPDFLLRSQELLELARAGGLRVLAYEEGEQPGPVVMQRLCAVRE